MAACAITYAVPATAAGGAEPVVSRGVTIPDFYTPPTKLPAANGALIRHEPLPLGLGIPGLDGRPMPGTATRLMYRSTDSNGQPVAVTGAYIEPSAAWKRGGPRPLMAVASGTMGQGDQCAPSMALQYPLTLNGETVSVGYESLAIYRLLAAGTAVVVTDYVGLGTTDRLHTYVNRVDEGHALLDAARAAHAVPGASLTAGSRTGLYGYSQGGGASASAAELQCVGDAILGYGFAKSSKWTNSGASIGDVIAAEPRAQAALDKQRIGNLKPAGPVRLATGVQDDIVPHGQARQLAVDWCRRGADITYDAVILPNLGDKLLTNHVVPLITDQGNAISWLTDRLAGRPATSNCWSMPIQPCPGCPAPGGEPGAVQYREVVVDHRAA
ncbi:lipase family protein [Streptomyces sp. ITFR-6]|nr:lipase family protein [Streptomyces sp. ITFR-6]WNI33989.1 lipase family protein [Streptomyces sp. ITFR-6]